MATIELCRDALDISFAAEVYLHARQGGSDHSDSYAGHLQRLYRTAFADGRMAAMLRGLKLVLS